MQSEAPARRKPWPQACHDPAVIETAVHVAANAMFLADRDGQILWINGAFTRLFGYRPDQVLGCTPRVLKSGRQSIAFYRELWDTIAAGKVWRGHLSNRKRNGEIFDVEQTVTPVCDERGEVGYFFVIYEDITERLRSEQRLVKLAMFDSLTGLPNRTQFQQRLHEAFARSRRNGHALAVMLVDLDHFKNVNDSVGHAGGDALLAIVSRALLSHMRDTDVVARLSGDEFAVLMENLERPEVAAETAERLIGTLSQPFSVFGASVQIGASIGIAVSDPADEDAEQLLRNADLAMYQAKSRGRSRYQFFDAAMDQAARRRQHLHGRLRAALRGSGLELHYEPQVDMGSGQVVGAEALLRWHDPAYGPIVAAEFMQIAEQDELACALNDWVLRHAIEDIAALHREVPDMVPVSVNVSASQFQRVDLAANLSEALARHGLPGAALRIEVPEALLRRPSLAAHDNLRALVEMDVDVVFDDFGGGGDACLRTLGNSPVRAIKLAADDVRRLARSERNAAFTGAMADIARRLGLMLIAQGVENAAQRDLLVREGCRVGQGPLYQAALPRAAFSAWLQQAREGTKRRKVGG